MDAQPPQDLPALARAVQVLQAQMAEMQKQFSELTQNPHKGYYGIVRDLSQAQRDEQEGTTPLMNPHIQPHGEDKDNPPNIPHVMFLQCVRCEYMWKPRSNSPKKCPSCKAPWWFMPRWRWGGRERPGSLV